MIDIDEIEENIPTAEKGFLKDKLSELRKIGTEPTGDEYDLVRWNLISWILYYSGTKNEFFKLLEKTEGEDI